MSITDILTLAPLLVIAGAPVVVMLVIAFYRNHLLTVILTLFSLLCALGATRAVSDDLPGRITRLVIMDGYALFFMVLIFGATVAVTLLSYTYVEAKPEIREEYYVLLLSAALGAAVLVCAAHFASFILGLEILNISLYALIAYFRTDVKCLEAGLKYLILASASDAFLLFGMSLVYSQTGTMEFGVQFAGAAVMNAVMLTGMGMVVIGIGFKLALVPFHMWTPDVYEGAPAPVAAFVATVSKGAIFAILFRYFAALNLQDHVSFFALFAAIATASMFVGNILALLQHGVKRILAYSSIAHMGYVLVAFLAGGSFAVIAMSYYLTAYFITVLGAFGVVTAISGSEGDADDLDEYRGMAWRRPWLSGVFAAMLLSLAGIPLTAGFIGKFYVLAAGIGSSLWLLAVVLVINSAIGLYYYLRIIVTMYVLPETHPKTAGPPPHFAAGVVLGLLVVLLVGLGVYPGPLIETIRMAVAGFV
ncbi:MAG TPA: NADH-quinone oxidoreductase subunit N [Desulfomonilaceae bacterium]|nr:NADH-quinone oxidoreductase subunit N [Desulfomonilaceae bacterium]